MRKLALTSLIGVLLVAGCGGSDVTKNAAYETAADLRVDLQKAGLPCDDWSDDDPAGVNFDSGKCDGMQLRVYRDEQARVDDFDGVIMGTALSIVATEQEMLLVVNRNWVAAMSPANATGIARQTGGQVVDPADYDLTEIAFG